MQTTLVGQTITISPRNQETGGNDVLTRKVLKQFKENGIRYYLVLNTATQEEFPAKADVYDQLFLKSKEPFKTRFTKGDSNYNPRNINFKIKN